MAKGFQLPFHLSLPEVWMIFGKWKNEKIKNLNATIKDLLIKKKTTKFITIIKPKSRL